MAFLGYMEHLRMALHPFGLQIGSVLLMVRVYLAPADRLATATLIEGRLLHVRIFLKRTLNFLIVY